jgi:hypothetical protein
MTAVRGPAPLSILARRVEVSASLIMIVGTLAGPNVEHLASTPPTFLQANSYAIQKLTAL